MEHSKVEYILINNDTFERLEVGADPKNWDNAEKTLKRSEKTYGVFVELSKDLEFTKGAANFLRRAYLNKGIEANVTLQEWKNYPNRDGLYLHSEGVFDFSDYTSSENYVKVPFKTGGLDTQLRAQESQKFELQRTTSINNDDIGELVLKDVALTSREIFLLSKLQCEDKELRIYSGQNPSGNEAHRLPFPVEIISNSDQENISQPIVIPSDPLLESITGSTGETSEIFYLIADRDRENVTLTFDFSFKIDEESNFWGDTDNKDLYIRLKRYNNGNLFNYVEDVATFVSITDNVMTHKGEIFTYQGEITTDILEDESLSLVAEMTASYGAIVSFMIIKLTNINCNITVQEDSTYFNSTSKAILTHETGQRLTKIITGADRYYSEFYGRKELGYVNDREYAFTGFSQGFWIRQFYDKAIEISLKDFLESTNAIHNTGHGVERINGVETLVHEDMQYFFQNLVTIILPLQVSDVERKAAKKLFNSNIEIGYNRPSGDNLYEEAMGLDEYNTKTQYTLPFTRVETTYKKTSKFRADSYGKEFARRKPQLNYPEEDTRYDKDVFVLDLKEGLGLALEERTWSDDFESAPTGVYSPETATNLRLTPFRCLERHAWFIGGGLKQSQDRNIGFSSSVGNSKLSTKKVGEVARGEDQDIPISGLEKPRFLNEWITFNHKVSYDINEQIYGFTNINGRNIPNFYGKVQFINEFGQKEFGYLFSLQPNDEGKWKLLKAI